MSTAARLPSVPTRELEAHLERYSQGLIGAGAPAVLLELHVGAEVWTHAAGVRNSAGEAVRATDPVHVGDLTQPLVAVSVLKLAEEGKLSLDEPASTYLPELQDLGQPLGLGGTLLTDGGPVPEGMVHGYTLIDGEPVDTTYAALHSGSGATGLVSTMTDLNTFFHALLDGRLVRRERVAEMQGPVHAEYGLGLFQWNDRCTNGFYYGYVGDVPGYGTVAMASADGSRRLALAVAYPPQPFPLPEGSTAQGTSAIASGMTQVAEDALNGSCRLGGDVWFGQGP